MEKQGINYILQQDQEDIDFDQFKNSETVLVLRAGSSPCQKDLQFEDNYKKAKDSEISIGVYWSFSISSEEDFKQDALMFEEAIMDKQFEHIIFCKVEDSPGIDSLSAVQRISDYCNDLKNSGYSVGLCSTLDFIEVCINTERFDKFEDILLYYYSENQLLLLESSEDTDEELVKSKDFEKESLESEALPIMNGCQVKFITKKATWSTGGKIPSQIIKSTLYTRSMPDNKGTIIVSSSLTGDVFGRVYVKDLTRV